MSKKRKTKIAALGAATLDVFLQGEALKAKRDVKTYDYVEKFELGAKLELDGITFSTGGGATNAAVTFARAGFDAAFLGKVADDLAGAEIVKRLKAEGVKTSQVACELDGVSGYSTLLLAPRGERTILVYRGVSEELDWRDFDLEKLHIDWLYISSLAGNLELLERVVKWAGETQVKIAIDPGSRELEHADLLKKLVPGFTILKGNREEIGKLYKGKTVKEILRQAARDCPYVVVTDGAKGSYLTDGQKIYKAGLYKDVKVVDRTGAGDAFGSGLVAKLAAGKSIEEALTFASANSTSVVQYVGAKRGILKSSAKLKPMKIEVSDL